MEWKVSMASANLPCVVNWYACCSRCDSCGGGACGGWKFCGGFVGRGGFKVGGNLWGFCGGGEDLRWEEIFGGFVGGKRGLW